MKNRSGQALDINRKHSTTSPTPVADQIGPRAVGTDYNNITGAFRVIAVVTDPSEARRILKRRAAQFAILVRDLHTGSEHYTSTVWTGSDRVLKAVA